VVRVVVVAGTLAVAIMEQQATRADTHQLRAMAVATTSLLAILTLVLAVVVQVERAQTRCLSCKAATAAQVRLFTTASTFRVGSVRQVLVLVGRLRAVAAVAERTLAGWGKLVAEVVESKVLAPKLKTR
jgi:hypothetical protein